MYRTSHVDLVKVFDYFAKFALSVFSVFCLFDRAIVPLYRKIEIDQFDGNALLSMLTNCLFPATLLKLLGKD